MDLFSRLNWDCERNQNFMKNAKIVYCKAGKVYQTKPLNTNIYNLNQEINNLVLLSKKMEL